MKQKKAVYIGIILFSLALCAFAEDIRYTVVHTDNGVVYDFSATVLENSHNLGYSVFHPFASSRGSGVLAVDPNTKSFETLFVPNGAYAIVYNIDASGTCGQAHALQPPAPLTDSNVHIISPLPGVWDNMQTLVVSVPEDTEVFYSYIDSDPLMFGFAYDKPVLIEKSGEVTIRITAVSASGEKIEKSVTYTATASSETLLNSGAIDFLEMNSYDACVSGGDDYRIVLPDNSLYSLGMDIKPYIKAQELSLYAVMPMKGYVPITVSLNNALYRFVLELTPETITNSLLIKDTADTVPVRITDWHFVELTTPSSVYVSFDKNRARENWMLYTKPLIFDRLQDEVVYWYAPSYKNGDVQTLSLYKKADHPLACMPLNEPVRISLDDGRYDIRYKESMIAKSLVFDTLYGSSFMKTLSFAVFADGIEQGSILASVFIDKKPPHAPEIKANANEPYSREDIVLTLSSEKGTDIYFASRSQVPLSEYQKIASSQFILRGNDTTSNRYKIYTYAKDAAGNMSDIALYEAVIDKNNYYVDESRSLQAAYGSGDGSAENPFSSFEAALLFASKRPLTYLHITGDCALATELTVASRLYIIGRENARIIMNEKARLMVDGGMLSIRDCIIEQVVPEKKGLQYASDFLLLPVISVKNGTVDVAQSVVSVRGGYSRSFISADNSSVWLSHVISAVYAHYYATCITAHNSTITLDSVDSYIQAESGEFVSHTASSLVSKNIETNTVLGVYEN